MERSEYLYNREARDVVEKLSITKRVNTLELLGLWLCEAWLYAETLEALECGYVHTL